MSNNKDFVSNSLRDVYFKIRAQELEMLQDVENGGIRSEFATSVKECLVCNSSDRHTVFSKDGFAFEQCNNCGFIYANPQIKDEKLKGFYEKSSYDAFVDVLLSDANRSYDTSKYNHGLDIIEKYVKKGRLLDVGCSVGYFPALAKDRGWEVTGLELNQRAVNHASNVLNINVEQTLLEDIEDREGFYRVVTLWGVIEHLQRPRDEVERVYKLLEPGGVFLAFCPNVESLVCRVLQEKAATFDGQVHCGYFSPTTLSKLMTDCGFRVVHTEAAQADMKSLFNYLNYSEPYAVSDFTGRNLLDSLPSNFQQQLERYVLENNLGYKMMMVCIKD